ncbi:MAG: hypothetical protein WEE64_00230 [Dehalococcoidia bacterium]
MGTVYLLPPPGGLKFKLSRARKHLRHLRRIIERFKASDPWTFTRQVNADGTYYLYRLEIAYPSNITLLVADEAIHHLRTVLDHLIVSTVEAVGKKVTSSHSFPIRRTKPKTEKEIASYEASLRHVPAEARALIDSLQPYTRAADAKSHPLAILTSLDNRFKHTSLHLLSHQVGMRAVPGIIQRPPPPGGHDSGDIFAEVPVGVNVEKDFEPYLSVEIAFSIRLTGLPDVNIDKLDAIYNYVRDEVIQKAVQLKGMPRRL